MNEPNAKANFYFFKHEQWQNEIKKLRTLVLACHLHEEVKWGVPCYTYNDKNIVLIHVFKQYCALLFFKGSLLKDDEKMLVQQTKNVQAARQMRFTSEEEITDKKAIITAYLHEAIEVEKKGLEVPYKSTEAFAMPEEFENKLNEMPALKEAFAKLTPGKQRGYLLYFSQPKQSKTRALRIETYLQQMLSGKGLQDK